MSHRSVAVRLGMALMLVGASVVAGPDTASALVCVGSSLCGKDGPMVVAALFSSVEGGPSAVTQYGDDVLKLINASDNTVEGNALGVMYSTCQMQSATGDPGSGGDTYLTIPLPTVDVATFFVCPEA